MEQQSVHFSHSEIVTKGTWEMFVFIWGFIIWTSWRLKVTATEAFLFPKPGCSQWRAIPVSPVTFGELQAFETKLNLSWAKPVTYSMSHIHKPSYLRLSNLAEPMCLLLAWFPWQWSTSSFLGLFIISAALRILEGERGKQWQRTPRDISNSSIHNTDFCRTSDAPMTFQ